MAAMSHYGEVDDWADDGHLDGPSLAWMCRADGESFHQTKRTASVRASEARFGRVTPEQREAVLGSLGGRCAYCGRTGATHADHVVPLARSGRHRLSNLMPACRRCNSEKSAKRLEDWLETKSVSERAAIRERMAESATAVRRTMRTGV